MTADDVGGIWPPKLPPTTGLSLSLSHRLFWAHPPPWDIQGHRLEHPLTASRVTSTPSGWPSPFTCHLLPGQSLQGTASSATRNLVALPHDSGSSDHLKATSTCNLTSHLRTGDQGGREGWPDGIGKRCPDSARISPATHMATPSSLSAGWAAGARQGGTPTMPPLCSHHPCRRGAVPDGPPPPLLLLAFSPCLLVTLGCLSLQAPPHTGLLKINRRADRFPPSNV